MSVIHEGATVRLTAVFTNASGEPEDMDTTPTLTVAPLGGPSVAVDVTRTSVGTYRADRAFAGGRWVFRWEGSKSSQPRVVENSLDVLARAVPEPVTP